MSELMSINDAARLGITLLRRPVWADPLAHMRIDVINGAAGPWVHLYDPFNLQCNGRDPVDLLSLQLGSNGKEWLAYEGPGHDSDEYRAAQARYNSMVNGASP